MSVCLSVIRAIVSVEGYCRGVPAGSIRVAWNVGDCPNQNPEFDVGKGVTGWVQTVRIIVEEVTIENASDRIV